MIVVTCADLVRCVTVVTLLLDADTDASVGVRVQGGDDAVSLLQMAIMITSDHHPDLGTDLLLEAAGVCGAQFVSSADQEVTRGGVAGPPVTALQKLGVKPRAWS